jgi:hypothetical protein
MRIKFSIAWKNFKKVFHTVEKSQKKFPYCGKILKKYFHSVEKIAKSFPYCGKLAEKFSIPWKTIIFELKTPQNAENGRFQAFFHGVEESFP